MAGQSARLFYTILLVGADLRVRPFNDNLFVGW